MISVVTITFNNFEELMGTIESVQGLPIEHIVINGGKCEKTLHYLQTEFRGKSLSEPDKGISDAFNKGVKLSTGKGIMFLNSGDRLLESEYLAWADQQLGLVDFTYSDIIFEDPLAGEIVLRPHGLPIGRGMPFPHQSMIVKKETFQEVGLFKLEYRRAMCFEFTCRMLKSGKKGEYYPKPSCKMAGGGISATQESGTIAESRRAMVENGMFDLKNRIFHLDRQILFFGRKTLLSLGLDSVLKWVKQLKNHP